MGRGSILSEALNLRFTPEEMAEIDAVAEVAPFTSRHAVARAALLLGVALIKADPTKLLAMPAPPKAPKASKATTKSRKAGK